MLRSFHCSALLSGAQAHRLVGARGSCAAVHACGVRGLPRVIMPNPLQVVGRLRVCHILPASCIHIPLLLSWVKASAVVFRCASGEIATVDYCSHPFSATELIPVHHSSTSHHAQNPTAFKVIGCCSGQLAINTTGLLIQGLH